VDPLFLSLDEVLEMHQQQIDRLRRIARHP
jgi:hypothetical protein